MKITSIEIKGLFNTFDYVIPLNQEDKITIIHAPNGFGKTIILKMLSGLFNQQFEIFMQVPLQYFRVNLDNDKQLEVAQEKKNTLSDEVQKYPVTIQFFDNQQLNEEKITPSFKKSNKVTSHKSHFSSLQSIANQALFDRDFALEYLPDWYSTISKAIKVHLIETERLWNTENESSKNITATIYSKEIKEKIESALAEYAHISQNLERTFPKRLMESHKPSQVTVNEIELALQKLEEKRKKLQSVGLWDKERIQDIDFELDAQAEESDLKVLSFYIEDVKTKLKVFDDLASRIVLFKDILNSRLLYKKIEITQKGGFYFLTDEGEKLEADNLSSGEQHELVMIYEMLFKVQPNTLILIDEPEISLHIVWQEKFLADLSKIIALNQFDVLMATHSPQIINDRWDLTVELKKKSDLKHESITE